MKKTQYSGEKIQKAGKMLRNNGNLSKEELDETMNIISFWRQVHEEPLQKALKTLQQIAAPIDKKAIFANRMKRTSSIQTKLIRFNTMSLYKMQDIGGCRVIIENTKKLNSLLSKLKKLPEFTISNGKAKITNYILNPKEDGYRGVHIIGKFKDTSGKLRFIEIQLRTPLQHYWATAVEIVDLFTKQSLKTNQGKDEWKLLFRSIGFQFALMEKIRFFNTLLEEKQYQLYIKEIKKHYGNALYDTKSEQFKSFRQCFDLVNQLDVIELLNGFAQSLHWIEEDLKITEKNGYVLITINTKTQNMTAKTFSNEQSSEAEDAYLQEEKKHPKKKNIVVAMVATPNIGELKSAYPNYFADSSQFLNGLIHIENAFVGFRFEISTNASFAKQ